MGIATRIRSAICAGLTVVVISIHMAPADAKDTLVWQGTRCHETVAVHPAPAVAPDGALVLLVYQCDEIRIGDNVYSNTAVSEISVIAPCVPGGTCPKGVRSTLLRQVADNEALVDGLRSLGIAASYHGQIEYDSGALTATVRMPRATYSLKASGGTPGEPGAKDPASGQEGASYEYEGKKGTARISYMNYSQTAREAVVTTDTTADPQLREWLGATPATTAGFVIRGHWDGTAGISAR